MPRRIDNFTSYFHRKQRDLYFVTFTQATKDPMGFQPVRDCEAIDGRRELLDWLREKLPSTDVGPILPFDSDSGLIAIPYDGSIYARRPGEIRKPLGGARRQIDRFALAVLPLHA